MFGRLLALLQATCPPFKNWLPAHCKAPGSRPNTIPSHIWKTYSYHHQQGSACKASSGSSGKGIPRHPRKAEDLNIIHKHFHRQTSQVLRFVDLTAVYKMTTVLRNATPDVWERHTLQCPASSKSV